MTLDQLYDTGTGEALEGIPELNGQTTISQAALSAHPYMWALEVWLFAGPDARLATERYVLGQAVSTVETHAYRIESTVEGVMTLRRGL